VKQQQQQQQLFPNIIQMNELSRESQAPDKNNHQQHEEEEEEAYSATHIIALDPGTDI
jgi:hypothetical protein